VRKCAHVIFASCIFSDVKTNANDGPPRSRYTTRDTTILFMSMQF
jgi:hypothetical protein